MKTQDAPADGRALPADEATAAAVRAAQERLWALRRRHEAEGRRTDGRRRAEGDGKTPPPSVRDLLAGGRCDYYSAPLAEHLRAIAARDAGAGTTASSHPLPAATGPALDSRAPGRDLSPPAPHDRPAPFVKVYPDLALGILRAKKAAPGRVWLLLRHADAAGRGWLDGDVAARLLTGDGALRICGRRQLANLLDAGEGLFWERRDGRIWLRSAARAAAGLGVRRLGGSPVAVPLGALTGGIGDARAHLYASFHSGRQRADALTGERRPRGPIARATLARLSAAAPNSQRAYERRARVGRRATIAVGPGPGAADPQETAWRRGRALFRLRDERGRHGPPGMIHLAWQLPNEYTGPHDTLPRGRQKRLNRALADLFHDGMTGNGEHCPARRFYGAAKAAMMARHDRERYWRGRDGVWYWQEGGELGIRNYELGMKTGRCGVGPAGG